MIPALLPVLGALSMASQSRARTASPVVRSMLPLLHGSNRPGVDMDRARAEVAAAHWPLVRLPPPS